MANDKRTLEEEATVEAPGWTIRVCTPNDRPELCRLYRAVYPNATDAEVAGDVRDEEAAQWGLYRDERGQLRAAVFVRYNGIVWLFVHPSDSESSEVKRGVLRLAEFVGKVLLPSGVRSFAVVYAADLDRLGRKLEGEGYFSKLFNVARIMHFTDSGEIIRAN